MRNLTTIRAEDCEDQDEDAEVCPLVISARKMTKAWQRTKSGFKGDGGKKAFWGAVMILMYQGRVEGDMGVSPEQGQWLELASRVTGKVGVSTHSIFFAAREFFSSVNLLPASCVDRVAAAPRINSIKPSESDQTLTVMQTCRRIASKDNAFS